MKKQRTPTVLCRICKKELPLDFFECPQCGTKNPQMHLVERTIVPVSVENAVLRPLEKISIRSGQSVDALIGQALEYWLADVNAKKTKVFGG